MKIALDYDGTFTEDKGAWTDFIGNMQARNHTVYIVTFRMPEDKEEDMDLLYVWHNVQTIFTSRNPKKEFCEKMGIKIDVWIDDDPDLIVGTSSAKMEVFLEKERFKS